MWRGPRVESTHAVAACACTVAGDVRYEAGTIDVPIFLRSAVKPFIAAAVVRSGAVARFGLDIREIAVIAASHNGEAAHVEAVASILAKIGARVSDLQCGVQMPFYAPAAAAVARAGDVPTQLHHNCSGKHAGILALSRMLDAPLSSYLDVDHPAERAILALCERAFHDRFTADRIGVDGCGIPAIALSLRLAATGFARLATLTDLEAGDRDALKIVRDAMIAEPWYVAGTERFDTEVMRATGGALLAKGGAEAVQGVGILSSGLGVVVKVVDGALRAVEPAALAVLDRLGALDRSQRDSLAARSRGTVRNATGRVVGEIVSRQ